MSTGANIRRKRALIIGSILVGISLGMGAATLRRSLWYAPAPEGAPAPEEEITVATSSVRETQVALEAAAPARLSIPALGIDARVQHVGRTKKGKMGIPSNFTDVAWYKHGPAPGVQGSAVIDGHVDNALALAGVFKRLAEIRPGDDVYVEQDTGERLRFVVEDVRSYPYDDVPLADLFERSDAARLNLVTCGGTWISKQRTYDRRVVVYTVLARD